MSKKVPDNWVEVAQIESERFCQTMRDSNVDVLINTDETFFQFFPEDAHVIAPVGSKRVGSTNETNDKKD